MNVFQLRFGDEPSRKPTIGRYRTIMLVALLFVTAGLVVACAPESDTSDESEIPVQVDTSVSSDSDDDQDTHSEDVTDTDSEQVEEPDSDGEVAVADDAATVAESEPQPEEVAVIEPPDWTTHAFLEDGYFVLGNPDAEVTILDAGDFL